MTKGFFAIGFALLAMVISADAIIKSGAQTAPRLTAANWSYGTTGGVTPAVSTASSTGSTQAQTEAATDGVTSNWAGYVATGGTYTGVSGTWTVPSISASTDALSADAAWIGIGGTSSEDLIQVGTEDTVENGQTMTNAFYEELPDTSQDIPSIAVGAGDTMSAAITQTSAGEWTITIEDLTNGESFTQPVYYDSSESSAEWIEEAPSDQSGIMSLDDFGTVGFSNASTVENGQTVSLDASGAEAIGMDNQEGEPLADVSTLGNDSFTVTRTDADSSDGTSAHYYSSTPTGGWHGGYGYGNQGSTPYTGYPHFRRL